MSEQHPPHVAAWEDFVLRLIAIYKLGKAAISLALGVELLHLVHKNLQVYLIRYVIDPFHFDSESRFWAWVLTKSASLTPHGLRIISYSAFFYALIFATEGIGLFLRKHWAEYMVLISTSSLLPLEFYEIFREFALWKLAVVVGNLAILAYLAHRLWLDAHSEEDETEDSTKSPPTADRPEERRKPAVSKTR